MFFLKSIESLDVAISGLTENARLIVGARCALRAAPALCSLKHFDLLQNQRGQLPLLHFLRDITASLAAIRSKSMSPNLASLSARHLHSDLDFFSESNEYFSLSFGTANELISEANTGGRKRITSPKSYVFSLGRSKADQSTRHEANMFSDIAYDYLALSNGANIDVLTRKLSYSSGGGISTPHSAEDFIKLLGDLGGNWLFWRDWYQGFLDGKPFDWELQRRVALIDDAIWEAGPEAVAKEIERIQAKFELEQEVAALKEQLSTQQQVIARTPQIGDNGGPPLDGPNAKAFKKDLVLIWSDLEELETELAKPEPSTSVLKRIAQTLSETALRIAAYCVETVDLVVKDAAKTIGKGAGGLIVAEFVKPGSIEAVAKAIGKYLTTFAN